MKKNVTILDLSGNIIGTTYPKRAKGFVKSGRACFVDGETVQLTCPPEHSMQKRQEDIAMSIENNNIIKLKEETETFNTQPTEKTEACKLQPQETKKQISENAKKLLDTGISLKEILVNLDAIRSDNGYINQALANLEKLPYMAPTAGAPIDTSVAARAEAAADIVKCRETTNQMMIKLYTQIYTDYMA